MKKILNNILHRIKEDSLNRCNEQVERQVEYKNMQEVKKCLAFWKAHADQNKWIRHLKACFPGVRVELLCFAPDETEMSEMGNVAVMRNEDLGFGGKIQNKQLLDLLEQRYDLFVDLTMETTSLTNYVLTHTRSSCIAGMKKEGGKADIVIDDVSEPIQFISALKDILSEINKN